VFFLVTSSRNATLDIVIMQSNLDFIYADDEPIFLEQLTAEINAPRLLEFDEYGLIMTIDLVAEEHAHRINRQQNPYRPAAWFDQEDTDRTAADSGRPDDRAR
jgi:hypothetical protein